VLTCTFRYESALFTQAFFIKPAEILPFMAQPQEIVEA
jgi:hypothetical protein